MQEFGSCQITSAPGYPPSVFYPLLDHIGNEIEARLVVPKEWFLAQYLIHQTCLSNPKKRITRVMPFAGDVPDKSFAVYRIGNMEMQMAKC
jgi:hypothetical protein